MNLKFRSSAAIFSKLDGRAFYRPVTTEYTTVAGFGLQQDVAVFAFIEKLTGFGRHGFFFRKTARRALDYGIKHGQAPLPLFPNFKYRPTEKPTTNCHQPGCYSIEPARKCSQSGRPGKQGDQRRQPAATRRYQKSKGTGEIGVCVFKFHLINIGKYSRCNNCFPFSFFNAHAPPLHSSSSPAGKTPLSSRTLPRRAHPSIA
jgi:hypothetical protein